jgi:hypothetical protein
MNVFSEIEWPGENWNKVSANRDKRKSNRGSCVSDAAAYASIRPDMYTPYCVGMLRSFMFTKQIRKRKIPTG